MIFIDTYERTIDDKNRIQIPAPFRNALDPQQHGSAFYIVPGERHNTLSLYPEKYFEAKVASIQTDQMPEADALDFEQVFYSMASHVEMDKQGRIVIPERQLSAVDLGKEVYVAGANYRLDVWRKSDYEEFMEQVSARRAGLHRFLRMPGRPTVPDDG